MRIRLIVNRRATGVSDRVVAAAAGELSAVGDVDVAYTVRVAHAAHLAGEIGEGLAVALGGDGTANEVVNGLRPGVRLGVLPAGASSILARQLGFPPHAVSAARVLARAVAAGTTREIGLGAVDGRRFTFAAGFGLDAEVVQAIDRRRERRRDARRPGDLQFVLAGLEVLRRGRYALEPRMTVRAGDDVALRASFLAIANQHPYTFFGRFPVRVAPRARFDCGLDAVAVGSLRPRQLWRLPAYALLWPRHAGGGDARIAYLHDVERLEVECDRPTALQVDGEFLGEVERASVVSLPRAVAVYVPPPRR